MIYIFSFFLFFGLSYILYKAAWNLPVWCQSWVILSTWGIAWVNVYCVMIIPSSLPYFKLAGCCFLGAFSWMLWLEFKQRRAKMNYWETKGLPQQLQDKPIYWSHKADNLLEWVEYRLDEWAVNRIERRIERERQEAVEEAERITNSGRTS